MQAGKANPDTVLNLGISNSGHQLGKHTTMATWEKQTGDIKPGISNRQYQTGDIKPGIANRGYQTGDIKLGISNWG
jgi:hypothetical protein